MARTVIGAGDGGEITEDFTVTGWPMFVVRTRSAHGWRVVALYRFFNHIAAAVVEAVDDGAVDATVTGLRRARVITGDEPVDLADLVR